MKLSLFAFLCVLCVLCGSAFCVDRTAFTFTHYDLEVRIDPEGHAIAARGKMRLRNDSNAAQRNLTLQISSSLAWRLIELDGKPLQYVADAVHHRHRSHRRGHRSRGHAAVRGAAQGDSGTGSRLCRARLRRTATRLTRIGMPAETAAHNDWDQVAEPITAVRGIGYVAWYPVSLPAASMSDNSLFAALDDWKRSQHDTTMRVNFCWVGESNLTTVANGRAEGVTRHALGAGEEAATNMGCSVYAFAPVATDGADLCRRRIHRAYAARRSTCITCRHKARRRRNTRWRRRKCCPSSTEWFGAPTTKVQVVQLPNIGDLPFESGPLLFTPLELTDRNAIQLRMIHQLVHASFSSPRPWIEEGLAHFAQALEREQQDGRAAALAYMQTLLPPLQAAEAR